MFFLSFTCWCKSYVIIQRQKLTISIKNILKSLVLLYVEALYGDVEEFNNGITDTDEPLSIDWDRVLEIIGKLNRDVLLDGDWRKVRHCWGRVLPLSQ